MTDSVPSAHQTPALNIHTSASRLAVLVINSDSAEQSLLNQLLEDLGHEVSVAANGTQAQELVSKRAPFSIIFLADELPDMDSFALAQALRRHIPSEAPPTPIITVCTSTGLKHLQHCLANGMNAVMRRPIVLPTLSRTLQLWCAPTPPVNASEAKAAANAPLNTNPELLALFLSILPIDHKALLGALNEKNAASAMRYAHRIKGAALTVGNAAVSDSMSSLEDELRIHGLARHDALSKKRDRADAAVQASIAATSPTP